MKTIVLSVRVGEALLAEIDAAARRNGMSRNQEAANMLASVYQLGEIPEAAPKARSVEPEKAKRIEPAPPVVVEVEKPKIQPQAKARRDCPVCGEALIPWGTSDRCQKCGRNW